MDMLTVAMNNYFACVTLQQLKPSPQFDVDLVRYIVCCEDNNVNHYIAIHHVQHFNWLLKENLEKDPKELNYDTL
eukprot:3212260-Ditylum_brightwellii.AAC.1